MINAMVYLVSSPSKKELAILKKYVRAQWTNSLRLGWDPDKIHMITNFEVEGVETFYADVTQSWSATQNKPIALLDQFKGGLINDDVWLHDLDLWQLHPLPTIDHMGLGDIMLVPNWAIKRLTGGSMVFRYTRGFEILSEMVDFMCQERYASEEKVVTKFFREVRRDLRPRLTELSPAFNLDKRFVRNNLIKTPPDPTFAVHFHAHINSDWTRWCLENAVSEELHQVLSEEFEITSLVE